MYNYYAGELNNVLGGDEYEEDDGTIAIDYDLAEDSPKMPLTKAQALADFTDSVEGNYAEEECATDLECDNASLSSLTTDLDSQTADQTIIDETSAENVYNASGDSKTQKTKSNNGFDTDNKENTDINGDKESNAKEDAVLNNAENANNTDKANEVVSEDEIKEESDKVGTDKTEDAVKDKQESEENKRAKLYAKANEILNDEEKGSQKAAVPKLDNFDKAILQDVLAVDGGENLAKLLNGSSKDKKLTSSIFGAGVAVKEGAVMKKHDNVLIEDSPFLKDVIKLETGVNAPFVMSTLNNKQNISLPQAVNETENVSSVESGNAEQGNKAEGQVIKEVIIKEPVVTECPMKCALGDAVASIKNMKMKVLVQNGDNVCDVCGHVNKKGTEFCEICSNYLVK